MITYDKPIRMIALDLDGTTLLDDKEVSPRVEKVLRSVIAQGITVVIASGRALASLPDSILKIKEIRYAITSNGASVYDIHSGACLHGFVLDPEIVPAIIEAAPEHTGLEAFVEGYAYAQEDFVKEPEAFGLSGLWPAYIQRTRKPVPDIRAFILAHKTQLDAVDLFLYDPKEYQQVYEELHARYPQLYITSSSQGLMEFSGTKEGKKDCVAWIAQKLQILPEEIIAFGDGKNDMDMLRYAGLGVAMGNAGEEVKQAADAVTLSNLEDGLAVALESILNLQQIK